MNVFINNYFDFLSLKHEGPYLYIRVLLGSTATADPSAHPHPSFTPPSCVSSPRLWPSFHPPLKRSYFGFMLQDSPRDHHQHIRVCFQHPDPAWRDRYSTGSQALGRITTSFGLEQDQEIQVNAFPYKKYKSSLRYMGLHLFLSHLKDGTLSSRAPLSMKCNSTGAWLDEQYSRLNTQYKFLPPGVPTDVPTSCKLNSW